MPKYRVSGGRMIFGNKPGTEFEAALDKAHEERLMNLGHIERVEEESKSEEDVAPDQTKGSDPEVASKATKKLAASEHTAEVKKDQPTVVSESTKDTTK